MEVNTHRKVSVPPDTFNLQMMTKHGVFAGCVAFACLPEQHRWEYHERVAGDAHALIFPSAGGRILLRPVICRNRRGGARD
jgi:hypothetical protein